MMALAVAVAPVGPVLVAAEIDRLAEEIFP